MKQKDVFSDVEGDNWFRRNREALAREDRHAGAPWLDSIVALGRGGAPLHRVLEIGCGGGQRGAAIATATGAEVSGIDPSAEAVAHARALGLDARQGTADALPFEDSAFDLVFFPYCLHWCDREDPFCIAAEGDRVLATPGWLVIHDFYTPYPVTRSYHHREGLSTFKMDHRRLFDWHPHYTCVHHDIHHHTSGDRTDEFHERTAFSILRKTHDTNA